MIVAFTGPRPQHLPGGFDYNSEYNLKIQKVLEDRLTELKPDSAITGMALGIDQMAALVCQKLKIPYEATIPCYGQENRWNSESQKLYYEILEKAHKLTVVSPREYDNEVMQIRNEYMVDKCDVLIACLRIMDDGRLHAGGTKNCYDYAKLKEKQIEVIDVLRL